LVRSKRKRTNSQAIKNTHDGFFSTNDTLS